MLSCISVVTDVERLSRKCTDLWRFPSDFNEYLFTWCALRLFKVVSD